MDEQFLFRVKSGDPMTAVEDFLGEHYGFHDGGIIAFEFDLRRMRLDMIVEQWSFPHRPQPSEFRQFRFTFSNLSFFQFTFDLEIKPDDVNERIVPDIWDLEIHSTSPKVSTLIELGHLCISDAEEASFFLLPSESYASGAIKPFDPMSKAPLLHAHIGDERYDKALAGQAERVQEFVEAHGRFAGAELLCVRYFEDRYRVEIELEAAKERFLLVFSNLLRLEFSGRPTTEKISRMDLRGYGWPHTLIIYPESLPVLSVFGERLDIFKLT